MTYILFIYLVLFVIITLEKGDLMKNILEVKNINKFYGKKQVLEDVSFTIHEGEILGFIGTNGSGKTTIFELIMGEEMPNSGQISIRKGATIGFLSQIPPKYNDDLTVKIGRAHV